MRKFWHSNGARLESFALNPSATAMWFAKLTGNRAETQHGYDRRNLWLFSFVYHVLLQQDRLLRPTAKQVLGRLQDLDAVYPVDSSQLWVGPCCAPQPNLATRSVAFRCDIPQWPILDLTMADDHLAHLFLDMDLEVFTASKSLSYLGHMDGSGTQTLRRLLSSTADVRRIHRAAYSILESIRIKRHSIKESDTVFTEMTNSVFTCSLRDSAFWVDFLDVYLEVDKAPRVRTVQLSLRTMCLSRGASYGAPFLVMTFDPTEGEAARTFDHGQKEFIDCGDREGKDIWTHGLRAAATLFEREKRDIYAPFITCIAGRRRRFDGLVSRTHLMTNEPMANRL